MLARRPALAPLVALLLGSCATVTLAPGADHVHLTRAPNDVAACSPAGNIAAPRTQDGMVDGMAAEKQLRNQTVGLGANWALVTEEHLGTPVRGIAYRCPQ